MTVRILVGDCRVRLWEFPNNFFHVCVTSWPYWGLRDYGIEPTVWGGDPKCEHVWGQDVPPRRERYDGDQGCGAIQQHNRGASYDAKPTQFCQLCGAWLGNFGLEPTPELYIQHGVEISREVRRVLRDDGTMWLNLGDTYWGGKGQSAYAWSTEHQDRPTLQKAQHQITGRGQTRPQDHQHPTIKPKDLVGIPWMAAFALRDDGWWLRQAIPWIKDNPMPESVRDRPTVAHEYLFLFSKGKRYYYDWDAVKEVANPEYASRYDYDFNVGVRESSGAGRPDGASNTPGRKRFTGSRNRRTADWWYDGLDYLIEYYDEWLLHLKYIREHGGMLLDVEGQPLGLMVNPEGFEGDHYATFPTRLVEPCLKASTSERGACPQCGAPWERVVEQSSSLKILSQSRRDDPTYKKGTLTKGKTFCSKTPGISSEYNTIGWRPTCKCYSTEPLPKLPRQRKKETDDEYAERTAPIRAERQRLPIGRMEGIAHRALPCFRPHGWGWHHRHGC